MPCSDVKLDQMQCRNKSENDGAWRVIPARMAGMLATVKVDVHESIQWPRGSQLA